MRFGRMRRQGRRGAPQPEAGAAVLVVAGALTVLLFLCGAVTERTTRNCPAALSAEAAAAFSREHTALSAALGIDEYFAPPAVSAGAFGTEGAGRTFAECLAEAVRLLAGCRCGR